MMGISIPLWIKEHPLNITLREKYNNNNNNNVEANNSNKKVNNSIKIKSQKITKPYLSTKASKPE